MVDPETGRAARALVVAGLTVCVPLATFLVLVTLARTI
jgi:hypothetical protein